MKKIFKKREKPKNKERHLEKRNLGPIVEIFILILSISVFSLVLHLLGISGHITDSRNFETTLKVVNNVFSKEGIKHVLNNVMLNFKNLEPFVMIILSLIAVSVLESSGLLKQVFTPLKKLKPRTITMLVMFVGIVSTIIGDYSYALLLPLAGILYRYTGRDSALGVLCMFVAITIGYGTGLIYNYQAYQLGDITEAAASSITANYNYELLSNIFILLASTFILTIVGTIVVERFSKKYSRNEEEDNLTTSKKASRFTFITFIILLAMFIYCVIPGLPYSGMLLDKTEPTYIGKLFGSDSPLNQGFMFLIIGILMICGFIYGKISRNIKNSEDYGRVFTKSFEGTGYIFVLLFFVSILYLIMDWSNLATVISTNIVDFIGTSNLSGVMLVIVAFLSIVIISILIPSSITKWGLVAPIYVPLLMRANISPAFTQMLYLAADSVGKLFSPIYIYFIITVGFMCKFDKSTNRSLFSTMKETMPVIISLAIVWIVIILGWYLTGLPMGINSSITL